VRHQGWSSARLGLFYGYLKSGSLSYSILVDLGDALPQAL
jgi:hypothetical protein